jgi:hypothetical protein
MNQQDLLRFARLGAQARLEILQREMDALLKQFPGLTAKGGRGKSASGAAPKRNMSAAARKRISDAAKKRWTEWRKKNKRD